MFGAELMRDLLMPAFSRDITNLRLFGSYKLDIVTHIVCVSVANKPNSFLSTMKSFTIVDANLQKYSVCRHMQEI